MANDEIVKCGTTGELVRPLHEVIDAMMANKVQGKETITFLQKDWDRVVPSMNDIVMRLNEMSQLTHVKNAHGLCKVTACQWEELGIMRERYKVNEKKIESLYKLIDGALSFVDRLIQEKLLAAEGWWSRKLIEARRELEDIKRT